MGAAIEAVEAGYRITRENPIYVAVTLVVGGVVGVIGVLLGLVPVVGPIANSVFVSPAFTAVVLGMAFSGLVAGDADVQAGVKSLKANYLSLAGAYALLVVMVTAVMVGIVVLTAVVGLFVLGVSLSSVSGGSPDAVAGVAAASTGVASIFVFLLTVFGVVVGLGLQFVGAAVVVGGESAVSSLRASWNVFASSPESVVGYTLLRLAVFVAAVALVGVAFAAGRVAVDSTVGAALGGLVALVVLPLAYAFLFAYHVAFYEARAGSRLDG